MDQQIEVLDLGLLVRTFAQELILPEVALQLKYEIPKLPEMLEQTKRSQLLRLLERSGLNSAGEAFHVRLWLQAHLQIDQLELSFNIFTFCLSLTRLLALVPNIMLSSLVLWRPPLTKGPAPFGISPAPTAMPCCITGLPTMADWMAMAGVTPVCLCCMAGVRAGVGGRLF